MEEIHIKQEYPDSDPDEEEPIQTTLSVLKTEKLEDKIKVEAPENEHNYEIKIEIQEHEQNYGMKVEVPEHEHNYETKAEIPEDEQDDDIKAEVSDNESDDNNHFVERPRKIPSSSTEDESCSSDVDKEIYDCPKCAKSFPKKTKLLSHLHTHRSYENYYTCAICKTDFKTNQELIAHKEEHKGEKRSFVCDVCNVLYIEHREYLTHMVIHEKHKKVIKCLECHNYYSKRTIGMHYMCHSNVELHCKLCKKTFKDVDAFNRDLKLHDFSIECPECGKRCCNNSQLRYHLNTHTGVKPYQCYYCGEAFSRSDQRNVHMKVHSDERPYKCYVCNESFYQYTKLRKHKTNKHSVIKVFQCDYCKKIFFDKWTLETHIYNHMGIVCYPCNVCKKIFTTYEHLKEHSLLKHKKFQSEDEFLFNNQRS